MARMLLLTLMLIGLPMFVFPQKRSISREQFTESYSAGIERSKGVARKVDSTRTEVLAGGAVKTTTSKWQFDGQFRSHLRYSEKTGQTDFSFEMINIDENTFCRIGRDDWKKAQGTCDVRVPWMVTQMSIMLQSAAKSEFFEETFVEAGEKLKRYTEVGKLEKRTLPLGAEVPPTTYESEFIIDSKGRFRKQEYTRYPSGSQKGTPSWVDLFSYDSKDIHIVAPIR